MDRSDLCGCGKPGRYIIADGMSCNKYRRCAAPPPPAEQASGDHVEAIRSIQMSRDIDLTDEQFEATEAAIAALSQQPEQASGDALVPGGGEVREKLLAQAEHYDRQAAHPSRSTDEQAWRRQFANELRVLANLPTPQARPSELAAEYTRGRSDGWEAAKQARPDGYDDGSGRVRDWREPAPTADGGAVKAWLVTWLGAGLKQRSKAFTDEAEARDFQAWRNQNTPAQIHELSDHLTPAPDAVARLVGAAREAWPYVECDPVAEERGVTDQLREALAPFIAAQKESR